MFRSEYFKRFAAHVISIFIIFFSLSEDEKKCTAKAAAAKYAFLLCSSVLRPALNCFQLQSGQKRCRICKFATECIMQARFCAAERWWSAKTISSRLALKTVTKSFYAHRCKPTVAVHFSIFYPLRWLLSNKRDFVYSRSVHGCDAERLERRPAVADAASRGWRAARCRSRRQFVASHDRVALVRASELAVIHFVKPLALLRVL